MGIFDFFKKKKSAFELIIDKLKSDLAEAKFSSNWKLKQEIQLKLKWLEIAKNQNEIWQELLPSNSRNITDLENVSNLSIDEIIFPQELDDQDILHYKFSEAIFKEYAAILANSGKYQNCFYKPASILPYPKEYIRKAIRFTEHYLQMDKPLFVPPTNKNEVLSNLRGIDAFLDNFVNANESELPSGMKENLMKGSEYN